MNLYALLIGERAPEIVNIVVEIPKATCNKVEYDPELEIFRLDRVHHSPVHYPGDYGFISWTLSPDKVLAVPENDPRFLEMRDLPDLPKHVLKEVEYFFNIYKEL